MNKFQCSNCSYQFDPKGKTQPPKICPYCSKEDTVNFKKHILEEL